MINKNSIDELCELVKSDDVLKPAYENVKKEADEILKEEPRGYIKVTYRLLESSKEVLRRVQKLGFAYFVTGDTKYAERAYREVEYMCCEWPDWNAYHGLDTAEASFWICWVNALRWIWVRMIITYRDSFSDIDTARKGIIPML